MIRYMLLIIMISAPLGVSRADDIISVDKQGLFSADLQNISLTEVKSYFEQNYEIEFAGDEDLLKTQRTVSFKKLNLEKTLKRIFAKMNIALQYNSKGEVTEVRLVPGGQAVNNISVLNNLMENREQNLQSMQTPDGVQENAPMENDALPVEKEEDEITSFVVEKNSPPGADGLPVDSDSPVTDPAFQVVPNSPPSGNTGEIFRTVPGTPPSRK